MSIKCSNFHFWVLNIFVSLKFRDIPSRGCESGIHAFLIKLYLTVMHSPYLVSGNSCAVDMADDEEEEEEEGDTGTSGHSA